MCGGHWVHDGVLQAFHLVEVIGSLDDDEAAQREEEVRQDWSAVEQGAGGLSEVAVGAQGRVVAVEPAGHACAVLETHIDGGRIFRLEAACGGVDLVLGDVDRERGQAKVDDGDTETELGAILGGVRRMEQVRDDEAEELEQHAHGGAPDEVEHVSHGDAVDVDLVKLGHDASFPVRRRRVVRRLIVRGELVWYAGRARRRLCWHVAEHPVVRLPNMHQVALHRPGPCRVVLLTRWHLVVPVVRVDVPQQRSVVVDVAQRLPSPGRHVLYSLLDRHARTAVLAC